jgi:hypothetical protein
MAEARFQIRPAREEDRVPMAVVFAAVAEERDGIGTEPPVDVEARVSQWRSCVGPPLQARSHTR